MTTLLGLWYRYIFLDNRNNVAICVARDGQMLRVFNSGRGKATKVSEGGLAMERGAWSPESRGDPDKKGMTCNGINGVYHNTVYDMAAILPVPYADAVVLGSNLSGLFAAIASICSSYIFSSHKTAAIYYFLTAILVFFLCFETYFALALNKFFRYHEIVRRKEDLRKVEGEIETRIPYLTCHCAASTLQCIFYAFRYTRCIPGSTFW
uniref:Uncharacterized protein n=1 Tax=Glossina austeni TaxID=7395 RepID=A0A1A9V9W4_GLOAU